MHARVYPLIDFTIVPLCKIGSFLLRLAVITIVSDQNFNAKGNAREEAVSMYLLKAFDPFIVV